MKIFILLLLFPFLICCGISNKNEIHKTHSELTAHHYCEVEIIKDVMPRLSSPPRLYAIIQLYNKNQEQLSNNWKIQSFKINGEIYTEMDHTAYSGKNQLLYRNNIRQLNEDLLTEENTVEVTFINEESKSIHYTVKHVKIMTVN